MEKAPCDSASNLRSNAIYLALQTILATEGYDWIDKQIIEKLEKSLETAPEELKPYTEELIKTVKGYNRMSKGVNSIAAGIFDKINESVEADGETINLITSHFDALKNETILLQCCEIEDRVSSSLSKFTEPILNTFDKFIKEITLNQLNAIILTTIDFTNLFEEKADGGEVKLNIPETKHQIIEFTHFLRREILETPNRFENAKGILEKFVEVSIKGNNPNNPDDKCTEETYIRSELYMPIKKLIAPSEQ